MSIFAYYCSPNANFVNDLSSWTCAVGPGNIYNDAFHEDNGF